MPLLLRNFQRKFALDPPGIERLVANGLTHFGFPDAVVGVHVVGATRMAALNLRALRRVGPTDVLSFPLHDVRSQPTPLTPPP
jgi:ssRNA-specific RNase YbeY (16S rRNA maturation enzyme)